MAREWSELLRLRGEAPPSPQDPEAVIEERRGFLRRLRESLRATREALGGELSASFAQTLEAQDWEALEEALIMADVGAPATAAVVEALERIAREERLGGEALRERLATLLAQTARGGEAAPDAHIDLRPLPTAVLIVGVNGTGKTTTLGKLAWQLREHFGLRVLLGCRRHLPRGRDRAARGVGAAAPVARSSPASHARTPGPSPSRRSRRLAPEGFDVVLIDTAGRLHNQEPLMGELEKVRRVIARQLEGAPHETLLTIDATTGQNGLRQAELFARAVAVDGIVLTKLDGSAKGGVAIAIARELGIPVKLVGVGEQLDDLRPFDADDFARALIGLD